MKLASYKNGGRDGELRVVSKDLTRCIAVPHIAATLQEALDKWDILEYRLKKAYVELNIGYLIGEDVFEPSRCLSPLPRAYQFADGSAYLSHVDRVRKARGATVPETFYTDPLMYQGASDGFLSPTQGIPLVDEAWGCDFEGEVAVITGDVPLHASMETCARSVRLLMLLNDVSLRNLIPNELAKGFGFFQGKPASAFSPVAVTPDELGTAWQGGKVHLPLTVTLNNQLFGRPEAGVDMQFSYYQLIAHVAKTRALCAGSIIGAGTVSNHDRRTGAACLAEIRMLEIIETGHASTPYLKVGDKVQIEMFDAQEQSIFGAIDQMVVVYD